MEHVRIIIAIALSFLVFFIWDLFFVEKLTTPPTPSPGVSERRSGSGAELPETVHLPAGSSDRESELASTTHAPQATEPAAAARQITVETPLYRISLSENGGTITAFTLKNYRQEASPEAPLLEMVEDRLTAGTLQTGFSDENVEDMTALRFTAQSGSDSIFLRDRGETLTFQHVTGDGIGIQKVFRFDPASYLIDYELRLVNSADRTIEGQLSLSLVNHQTKQKSHYGYAGPSALIDGKLKEIKIKDLDDNDHFSGNIGWVAFQERYFMTAIIVESPQDGVVHVRLAPGERVETRYFSDGVAVAPGGRAGWRFNLFLGPKSYHLLKETGYELDKAVKFGMFDMIAKPCLWLMNGLYRAVPNYGFAIIVLTMIIKVLFWPLGNKSYKSMAEMKKLQPLMMEMREKYKNDKRKMNEETMKLYRLYKVNPLGGCLPMLVQIPVFFALYNMLYSAIELRHAPFFGWINDLSAPDRLFHFGFAIPGMQPPYGIPVLTIIMGGTMFLQQKMQPPMGDPAQAKMMMFMPLIFTVIFVNFSSGLVLYWLVNNVLSIAQQHWVTKKHT